MVPVFQEGKDVFVRSMRDTDKSQDKGKINT